MKIIGITGGIGSGKSTVLKLFQEFGMTAYIADIEAKKLMNKDKELIDQITNLFGKQAYINGILDSTYISSIVFNNKEKLDALNALVHPKVKDHFKNFIDKENTKFILYEAAILFETGSNSLCDYIIAVTANFEDKIKRVMLRDEVSKKQVMERMKNQLKDNFKIRNADFVIRNGSLEHTKLQVATIFDLIVKLNI